jgi:two-component system CheB/CheR fusion protein
MNEELQSTNEELETSKEEMQSLNEELTTVNTELTSKLDDLGRTNDDMQNLLNSTEVATVFVDNELRIKRYTEQATKLIKLIPTDIGRPLGDLVSNLKRGHFLDDARDVLRSLVYKEVEVQTADNRWYLMRLAPYRTSDNVIDGLVITFVDINRVKQVELSQADGNRFIASLIDGMRHPVLVLDPNSRVTSANRAFHDTFRIRPEILKGKALDRLEGGPWNSPELAQPLRRAIDAKKAITNVNVRGDFAGIGRRSFVVRGWPLQQSVDHGAFVLEMEDVTNAKTPS